METSDEMEQVVTAPAKTTTGAARVESHETREHHAPRIRGRRHLLAPLFIGMLLTLVIASAGIGAVRLSAGQVLTLLAEPLGIELPWTVSDQERAVFWVIRLPRIALGTLVGGGLATAGAALQGLFRNPLADPGLIGVSAGASFAAALVIVLGSSIFGTLYATGSYALFALPLGAFIGGLLAVHLVFRLARNAHQPVLTTMLLAGIAINALAGAGTGFLTFIADDAALRGIAFWSLGSLGGATWKTVAASTPFLLLSALLLPRYAMPLNLVLLGEAEAAHLGVDVEKVRRGVILLAALGVGAAVAFAGVIGFVGLVVPHLVRLIAGPDHRALIPLSGILGAALLVGADLLARTIVAPAELPIGVVTAAVGAPFFLWLLVNRKVDVA